MPNRQFWLDEGPPLSTKPCEDRAACGPGQPNTTLHHNFSIQLSLSSINSINVIQEPWSWDGWSIELYRPTARPADLPCTTLGGLSKHLFYPILWTIVMISWQVFQLALSNLCKWSKMLQLEWSLTSWREHTSLLSSQNCTGFQLPLASNSIHWHLPTEQPLAPTTITLLYDLPNPTRAAESMAIFNGWRCIFFGNT